jgi:hypothetical protein
MTFKEIIDGYVKAQIRLREQNFRSRLRAVNSHDQELAEPENNERFSNEQDQRGKENQ